MATLVGLGIIISVVLIGVGLIRRRAQSRPIDSGFTAELTFDAIQLGAAITAGLFPSVYLIASMAVHGGSIEQNLPQGVSAEFLLGVVFVGSMSTLIYTFFNYRKHLGGRPPSVEARDTPGHQSSPPRPGAEPLGGEPAN